MHENKSDLPFDSTQMFLRGDLTWKEIQELAVRAALTKHEGNRTHASISLGISVRCLRNKIHEFGLEDYAKPSKQGLIQ
jgi:DNA-binding NtrC family response regulator